MGWASPLSSRSPVYPSRRLAELKPRPLQPRHLALLPYPPFRSLSTYYRLDFVRGRSLPLPIPPFGVRLKSGCPQSPIFPGAARARDSLKAAPAQGLLPQVRGRGERPSAQCRWGKGARVSVPLSQGKGAFSHFRAAKGPDLPPPGTRQKISPGSPCCPHPAPGPSRRPSPPPRHTHCPWAHLGSRALQRSARAASVGMGRRRGS